jgi:hypothetical protein
LTVTVWPASGPSPATLTCRLVVPTVTTVPVNVSYVGVVDESAPAAGSTVLAPPGAAVPVGAAAPPAWPVTSIVAATAVCLAGLSIVTVTSSPTATAPPAPLTVASP